MSDLEDRTPAALMLVTLPKIAQGFPSLVATRIDLSREMSSNVDITITTRWQDGQIIECTATSISEAFQQALHQREMDFLLGGDTHLNRINVILVSFGLRLVCDPSNSVGQAVKKCGTHLWIGDECVAQLPSDEDGGRINLTMLARIANAEYPLTLLNALGFTLDLQANQLTTPHGVKTKVRWERATNANWLEVAHPDGKDYLLEVQDQQGATWVELRCLHWLYGL